MIQRLTFLLISLLLVACGKKGPVEPLEPSDYPRTYPKPLPSLSSVKKPQPKGCCDG